ncbi:MAG: pseudouridine synthase [Chitinophagaceae bacterium]
MTSKRHFYYKIHKPYNMVSQFVSPDRVRLLGDLPFKFPEETHAVGRLDNHSEGLLLLTTDSRITRLLFEGIPHTRTYHVQVCGTVNEETLARLGDGVSIRIRGGGYWTTTPSKVSIVQHPTVLTTPVELLKEYPPYTWLEMVLTEGKFHQVRKMVAAVNHKCRRLIRVAIEDMQLDHLPPGDVQELSQQEFFRLLHLESSAV